MEQQELLQQIEPYKRADGSYDVRRREKELGISFVASFWGDDGISDDPLLAKMVEINGQQYNQLKAAIEENPGRL